MKVNELRVGNYTDKGKVKSFYEHGIHVGMGKCYLFCDLSPTPLTNELLLKCGFKSVGDDVMVHKLNRHFRLEYALDEYVLRIKTNNYDSSYIRVVKHLHQLQNLYFAITGEELEVDLDSK